jgi:hypothetical protein
MYEFISLAEPAPLELFNIDSMLESINSNSNLFEGLFGDPNAGEELQLANPLETNRMANSLSSPNVDPQNCVLPNLSPAVWLEHHRLNRIVVPTSSAFQQRSGSVSTN